MFSGTMLASVVNVGFFYVVTVFLVDPYMDHVGPLVHDTADDNRALLHLVTQGSVFGGLGGSLYVFQLIANYISRGAHALMIEREIQSYFLYAMIVPFKGLIAGLIGATIVGGLLMLSPLDDGLRDGHLFIIGCACIAGYSEQFLQQIVDTAGSRLGSIAKTD